MEGRFLDRYDAGQQLAERLLEHADDPNVIVLGLPRGGVPVAYEVASRLRAPLDVFVVRKLGVPGQRELAMGAIASGGVRTLQVDVVRELAIPASVIDAVEARERAELARREREYRGGREPLVLANRKVILVDDGLATGATMIAAVSAARRAAPAQVIVAVPVASPETCHEVGALADEIVCLITPEPLLAVGLWYADFSQTTDYEVRALLSRAGEASRAAPPPA
jgi:predicted phosphoribosyltransferase